MNIVSHTYNPATEKVVPKDAIVIDAADFRGKMPAAPTVNELPSWLRNLADSNTHGADVLGSRAARLLADQIEAQTKPPRIPEPGLWGVVEASSNADAPHTKFVHTGEKTWRRGSTGEAYEWPELIDPTLVRDGIGSAS